MFKADQLQARKYRSPEGDGGGTGNDPKASDDPKPKDDPKPANDPKPTDDPKAKDDPKPADDPKTSDREAELLRETMQRKQALKEAQEKIDKLSKSLEVWNGLDPEQVRGLIQAQKDEEQKKLEAKGEFDKVKAQMVEAHQAEVKTLQDQINELKDQLSGRDANIAELTVGNAFGQSKYIAEQLTLPVSKARTLYGAHFERDEKGKIVGYDSPKGTKDRAMLVDANGQPLAFDQALAKIIEKDPDRDSLIRSTVKPGAGSKTDPTAKSGKEEPKIAPGENRIAAAIAAGGLKAAVGLKLSK